MDVLMHRDNRGYMVHLADAQGNPVCCVRLNLALWHLCERNLAALSRLCYHCRRIHAQRSGAVSVQPAERVVGDEALPSWQ